METTQSIKVNTLTKAIPLFYLLLLIFLCTVVYLLFLCGTVQLNQGQNFQNESFLIKNLISFCSISINGSSHEEVYDRYLRIAAPEKWIKYLKNNFEGVHFSVHSKLSNIYFYQKQAPSQVFIKDFARIKFFPQRLHPNQLTHNTVFVFTSCKSDYLVMITQQSVYRVDHQIFDRKLSMSSIKYQNASLGKTKFSNEDHDCFYRNVVQITLIVIKVDTVQMAWEYL